MIKINNFAYMNTADQKILTYTYSTYDADGNLLRNNIRKSTPVKDTEVDILGHIEALVAYLVEKESV